MFTKLDQRNDFFHVHNLKDLKKTIFHNFKVTLLFIVKAAATDTKYFAGSKFSRSCVHKKNWLDVTSSLQVKILRQDSSFKFEWIRWKVVVNNYSLKFCKEAITNFLLAHSFWKMFFIGQNLNSVLVIYSFDQLWIFFWLTLVVTLCLKFYFSSHMKMHTTKDTKHDIKTNRNTFLLVPNADVEESMFWYW